MERLPFNEEELQAEEEEAQQALAEQREVEAQVGVKLVLQKSSHCRNH